MKKLFFSLSLCLALAGCVIGSSNPFYTPDLVVAMPELHGTWYFDQSIEPEQENPLEVSEGKMMVYDEKGAPAETKAIFFKIDDALFVDIFPDEGQLKTDLVGESDPVHLINRVVMDNGKISFNPLDYEWLAKELEEGRIQLPYEKIGDEQDILLKASSEQWVEFLKKYKDDPKAFPTERQAWLVRKEQK